MHPPAGADELRIELLGPLVVTHPDVGEIGVASRPQRRLLAVLALHVGEVVRSTTLEECLGLTPGALRTSVSRLRRLIGTAVVETLDVGYRLRATVDVDVARFERLADLAPGVGDAAARAALEEADRLWRDDPLVEFAGEAWIEPTLRRLAERHATVVEDLTVLRLDAGEDAAALVPIRSLVDREPFRERAQALLMRALVEGGRPTEALRAFHTYRTVVCGEVGTEPSHALVELDRAIASSIETGAPIGPRPRHPAWSRDRRAPPERPAAREHAPPVPVSSFVGRHRDTATVLELLNGHRLVTLTGSGGCGKTRLAIAAATALAAGGGTCVRWVELGEVTVPGDVTEHVAVAVGATHQPQTDSLDHLVSHLNDRRSMLLVLDNAEHLLAPVTELLAGLLPRCASLRVLVTSREPLGITGEVVWRVPSLAVPPRDVPITIDDLATYESLQLFVERARDARPGLVLDDETLGQVAAICIGVDGLPLAVELSAARTRTLPIETVAAGISDAVRWRATGRSAPIGRHATLHASIAWSVDLLAPLARAVLVRLSVFQSSFTLDAALAVGADGEPAGDVADAVRALVDASLVQFDGATDRYRMLNTVRRFCTVRTQDGDELTRARARHAHHFASFCADIGGGRRGIERSRFIGEMPDLVAAMDWARTHEPRLVFDMCAGLASVRSTLGHHANVADTWSWLLSLDRTRDDDADTDNDTDTDNDGAGGRSGDWTGAWATAVAAHMAAATAHRSDVGEVVDEVTRLLPADADRARGWLARGTAMFPAYGGHLGPMLAHVHEARARGDDLEDSIYGGFVAYMLALMGRVPEAACQLAELARLTRRHRTTLRVDTVGNGYAAAILTDVLRGDLRSATARGHPPIPADPAFSMTAAAALAHVALVADDRPTYERAVEWSRRRTIPILRFLPTYIDLVGRRLDGDLDHAADLAEQFWDEAAPVPVSRVHPLATLTRTLVDAGRSAWATAMVDEAAGLVDGMDPAPLLTAGVLESRAVLASEADSVPEAAHSLVALLDLAVADGLVPVLLDALDQVVAITDDDATATVVRASVDAERRRMGVPATRSVDTHLADRGPVTADGGGRPAVPLDDAVTLARGWLSQVAEPADVG